MIGNLLPELNETRHKTQVRWAKERKVRYLARAGSTATRDEGSVAEIYARKNHRYSNKTCCRTRKDASPNKEKKVPISCDSEMYQKIMFYTYG
jgi:hypothetical protein